MKRHGGTVNAGYGVKAASPGGSAQDDSRDTTFWKSPSGRDRPETAVGGAVGRGCVGRTQGPRDSESALRIHVEDTRHHGSVQNHSTCATTTGNEPRVSTGLGIGLWARQPSRAHHRGGEGSRRGGRCEGGGRGLTWDSCHVPSHWAVNLGLQTVSIRNILFVCRTTKRPGHLRREMVTMCHLNRYLNRYLNTHGRGTVAKHGQRFWRKDPSFLGGPQPAPPTTCRQLDEPEQPGRGALSVAPRSQTGARVRPAGDPGLMICHFL